MHIILSIFTCILVVIIVFIFYIGYTLVVAGELAPGIAMAILGTIFIYLLIKIK